MGARMCAVCVCMFPPPPLPPRALRGGGSDGAAGRIARTGRHDEPASARNGQTAAHGPLLAVPPPQSHGGVRPHLQFLANCRVLDTPTPRGGGSDGAARSMVMMRRHDESASARNGQTVAHQPLWAVVSLLLSSSAHAVLSPVSGSAACTVSACRREAGWATEHM